MFMASRNVFTSRAPKLLTSSCLNLKAFDCKSCSTSLYSLSFLFFLPKGRVNPFQKTAELVVKPSEHQTHFQRQLWHSLSRSYFTNLPKVSTTGTTGRSKSTLSIFSLEVPTSACARLYCSALEVVGGREWIDERKKCRKETSWLSSLTMFHGRSVFFDDKQETHTLNSTTIFAFYLSGHQAPGCDHVIVIIAVKQK